MRSQLPLTVRLGLLAGLAALLQLGPVWWPGGGYLLAMAATLPVAVGSALAPSRSNWFLAVAAAVTGILSLEEMFVFVLTTGPLGLMIGLTHKRAAIPSIVAAGLLLTLGMLILPMLSGVYAWGGLERNLAPGWAGLAYTGFAFAYAAFWRCLFQQVWRRVAHTMPPDDPSEGC